MMLPKVSLIIPCYNAGKYISRMLDSIIAQKYTPLELILINDDSTDNTDDVIQQYLPLLKKNEIVFDIDRIKDILADDSNKCEAAEVIDVATSKDIFE